MQNNFNLILPLLNFDYGTYHVQITQRSKDGHSQANKLVTEWFVKSEKYLDFLMPGIVSLCDLYNARCYINLNPKSDKDVSWKIMDVLVDKLKTDTYKPLTLLSHSHDSCTGNGIKYWVVDIDSEDVDQVELIEDINKCRSGAFYNNVIATIPTKTGTHLITVPFDLSAFLLPVGVEIKKNASTILYVP